APIIGGLGPLTVLGGGVGSVSGTIGGNGRIRLEAFQQNIPISAASPQAAFSTSFPTNTYLPHSSVKIVSIDGISVPQSPAGTFLSPPDVTINKSVPVSVVVQATGIAPGTTIK